MTDQDPDLTLLLSLCAVLERFDRDVLRHISGAAPELLDRVLADPRLAPAGPAGAGLTLPAALRAELQARVRRERPLDELGWMGRAFEYYHAQLALPGGAGDADRQERCFFFLDRLFTFLYLRLEWQRIREHLAKARALEALEPRYQRRLRLYEGFVAIRTGAYDQGGAIVAALLGEQDLEPSTRLTALLALGQMQRNLTQYDKALATYAQLSALALELQDEVYHAVALINMGSVAHELERYEPALDLVLQSLRIFERHQDLERGAYAHYSAGLNAMFLGRWELAREHYGQAAALFQMLRMETTSATSYWSQGFLSHLLGDEAASEAAYLRTIEIIQAAERGEPIVAMDAWLHLGLLYATQARHDEALEAYQRAIEVAAQLRYNHRTSVLHYQRGRVYQAMGRASEAIAAYRLAIAAADELRSTTGQEDVKISLLGTTQQIYEAAVLLLVAQGEAAEAFHLVEQARSRAFLDSLAQKSPELLSTVDQPVVTLAEVQARLPEGALLLEYFTTGVLPRGEHLINQIPAEYSRLREQLFQPPRTLLFAVGRDRFEVLRLDLDPNRMRPPTDDPYPGRHLLHGRLPQSLYERLVAPAAHLLQGCDTLYLVPHGPLHYVPFGALRSPAGEHLVRTGGPALAQAPSATILMRSCLARPAARSLGALTIGYNDELGRRPLRYAEAEARHIAGLLGGQCWAGPGAKSERLLRDGCLFRLLHIAGHARFDPLDPLGSALELGQGDALSARGILAGLELDAELVTLSSCTSGVSHVVPGDELLGIQRALLYAGAPSVVCTRWEAGDLTSLLVMERFYQALRSGAAPAAALRDAQVAVRELTRAELDATISSWQAQGGPLAEVFGDPLLFLQEDRARAAEGLPDAQAAVSGERPFADALLWAPFMLIGRA